MRKYSLIIDEREVNLNQIPEFRYDMTEFQNLVAFTGHFKNQDEMSDWLYKRHLIDTSLPLNVFIGARSGSPKNGVFQDIGQPIIYKKDIALFNPKVIMKFFELNYFKPDFIKLTLGKFRDYYYRIASSRIKKRNEIEESYKESLSEIDRNTVMFDTKEYVNTPIKKDIRDQIEAKNRIIKRFNTEINSIDEIIHIASIKKNADQDLEYQRGLSYIINNILYDENGKPRYRNIARMAIYISNILDYRVDLSIVEPNYDQYYSDSIVSEDIESMEEGYKDIFDLVEDNVENDYYENLEGDLKRALIGNDLEYVYTLLEIVEKHLVKLNTRRTKYQNLALTDINIIMAAIKFGSEDGVFGYRNREYESAKYNLLSKNEWVFVQNAISGYYRDLNSKRKKQK